MFHSLVWQMHWLNWDLATSGGTLDHFSIDDQLAFAALYDAIFTVRLTFKAPPT